MQATKAELSDEYSVTSGVSRIQDQPELIEVERNE